MYLIKNVLEESISTTIENLKVREKEDGVLTNRTKVDDGELKKFNTLVDKYKDVLVFINSMNQMNRDGVDNGNMQLFSKTGNIQRLHNHQNGRGSKRRLKI